MDPRLRPHQRHHFRLAFAALGLALVVAGAGDLGEERRGTGGLSLRAETSAANDSAGDASNHWSYRPLRRPEAPRIASAKSVAQPIDAFVMARLETHGLALAEAADRVTLCRRLYLDLLGLLPPPEVVTSFASDASPWAVEKLVDLILASPHFGERWGRHWLDLARYADSNGYEDDQYRPDAWRFRDWVVSSFNHDQPFDQFTVEQIAGDLLPAPTYAQRVATGFHRMTPSNEAGAGNVDEEYRVKTVKDRIGTTGTVWLGLTVGCAECHAHKYDPLNQREYYELYAFYDQTEEFDIDAPSLPARFWDTYAVAKKNAKGGFDNLNNIPKPPSTKALTLISASVPRQSYVHERGDFRDRGENVSARTPRFLPPLAVRGSAADRLDLARWIVSPTNPLTARVVANRVWQHLFGRGLVPTPEDFGIKGEPPSHPLLLDWLAAELLHSGWQRKALIRRIVLSSTYQQSSRGRPELRVRDPENRLLARQNRVVVEAEVVRDLALGASQLLVRSIGGPSVQPPLPSGLTEVRELKNENFREEDQSDERYRRGLYVNVQRTFLYPSLRTFDVADPNVPCTKRERSVTPLQALTLLNERAFLECARELGRRLAGESDSIDQRIRQAFQRCLARQPSTGELNTISQLFATQRTLYNAERDAAQLFVGASGAEGIDVAESAAWLVVARTLINVEEFITRE